MPRGHETRAAAWSGVKYDFWIACGGPIKKIALLPLEIVVKKGQRAVIDDALDSRTADRPLEPERVSERRKRRKVSEIVMGGAQDLDGGVRGGESLLELMEQPVVLAFLVVRP